MNIIKSLFGLTCFDYKQGIMYKFQSYALLILLIILCFDVVLSVIFYGSKIFTKFRQRSSSEENDNQNESAGSMINKDSKNIELLKYYPQEDENDSKNNEEEKVPEEESKRGQTDPRQVADYPSLLVKSTTKSPRCRLFLAIVGFILDIAFTLFLLLMWDITIMFTESLQNSWAGLIKILIILPLVILLTIRFGTLFNTPIHDGIQRLLKISPVILLAIFVYVFFSFRASQGVCAGDSNNDLIGLDFGRIHFSTAFIRNWGEATCPISNSTCLVYATLPEEALSGVFITFHINKKSGKNEKGFPTLIFAEHQEEANAFSYNWKVITPILNSYESPPHENARRFVYTAYLTDLEEGKSYDFQIIEPTWEGIPHKYIYKNLDTNDMTIIASGDIGNNKYSDKMIDNTVIHLNADLFMIGGDIAYDNGVGEGYGAWDVLLRRFPFQVFNSETNVTRVIPMIFATGNHEYGTDSYKNFNTTHNEHQPVFKHFFPQHTFNEEVPTFEQRSSYFAHRLGSKMLLLSLDAGYNAKMEGAQTTFLEEELKLRPYTTKIAQYHNPIYPGCFIDREVDIQTLGKTYWTPLFDQYHVDIAIENHSHIFKVSKKIKADKIDDQGTLYIGEGSFGQLREGGEGVVNDLMQKMGTVQSVWVLKIEKAKVASVVAYDENYNVLFIS